MSVNKDYYGRRAKSQQRWHAHGHGTDPQNDILLKSGLRGLLAEQAFHYICVREICNYQRELAEDVSEKW